MFGLRSCETGFASSHMLSLFPHRTRHAQRRSQPHVINDWAALRSLALPPSRPEQAGLVATAAAVSFAAWRCQPRRARGLRREAPSLPLRASAWQRSLTAALLGDERPRLGSQWETASSQLATQATWAGSLHALRNSWRWLPRERPDAADAAAGAAEMPRVIHKVFIVDGMGTPALTESMQDAVDSFRRLNPDFRLILYSGSDCAAYIREHFGPDVLGAFHALRPYAYKCDLFRYLVLLREGGYYSDMRQVCLRPLEEVLPAGTQWFSALDGPCTGPYMSNSFLASVPGHPWLEAAVGLVLDNVKRRHYGVCSLDPTGPGAFYRACDFSLRRPTWLIGEHRIEDGDGYIVGPGEERFILTKYRRESDGRAFGAGEWGAHEGGGQNYNDLWDSGTVYLD